LDWSSRRVSAILENALLEDRATRDATTYACIDPNQRASATIIAKQDCVLSGLGCISRILDVFAALDGTVTFRPDVTSHTEIFDGVRLRKGQYIAVIVHNARVVLSCERVILNIMQRMSGIATLTRRYVDAVAGTGTTILDTGAQTSNNGTNTSLEVLAVVNCYTSGTSGTVWAQGYYIEAGQATFSWASTSTSTVNTTITNLVDVTFTWGTASASNTITQTNVLMRSE
jgi:hypothetical protein